MFQKFNYLKPTKSQDFGVNAIEKRWQNETALQFQYPCK